MVLVNHTPFPAISFESVDQQSAPLNVICLRQTLSFENGELEYADAQTPLREVDVRFEDENETREESDLCAFKPNCDVIVNGSAYAPAATGRERTFLVRLRVLRSPISRGAELPAHIAAEQSLLDKALLVSGPSTYRRRALLDRIVRQSINWTTLGLLHLPLWQRTRPEPIRTLPLRYKYAFGGEKIVSTGHPAYLRVPSRYRDSPASSKELRTGCQSPVNVVFDQNPRGKGFTSDWLTKALREFEQPAPQLEHPDNPITAALFERFQTIRELTSNMFLRATISIGVRSKTDPRRAQLLGTLDDDFIRGGKPLPPDFDFNYLNCAHPDQQVPWLTGGEVLELTNLCPLNTPGLTDDCRGNKVLTLTLPAVECFTIVRSASGELAAHPLFVDTVIIEPTEFRVSLVWRATMQIDPNIRIRRYEVRMRTHDERDSSRLAAANILAALMHNGRIDGVDA